MPLLPLSLYIVGAVVISSGVGYSLNKIEDISKIVLVGGGLFFVAKLSGVIK